MTRLLALLLLWPSLVLAQSSPGWPNSFRPTMSQWNQAFAGKQDYGSGAGGIPGGATYSLQYAAGPAAFGGILLAAGQVPIGQTSGAPAPVTVTGSCTITASGVLTCSSLSGGSSGGIPYYNSGGNSLSSGVLSLGVPILGGGPGGAPTSGSKSGNTSQFMTGSGSFVSGDCAKFDSNGNVVDAATTCLGGGGGGGNPWTLTDGTHPAVPNMVIETLGVGFCVSGSAGSAAVNFCAPEQTQTSNYTIATTDMGGQVNGNGSSITFTIPTPTTTIFGQGQQAIIGNYNSTALTISHSGFTTNGLGYSTLSKNMGMGCSGNSSSGASIDCYVFSDYRDLLALANAWTAPQRGNFSTPTISTATFTPVIGTSQNYRINLTSACSCTLANPSGTLVAGQAGMIEIAQDGTGSRVIGTWGSAYVTNGGTASITLSTAASTVDYLPYMVDSTATKVVLGGLIKGPTH